MNLLLTNSQPHGMADESQPGPRASQLLAVPASGAPVNFDAPAGGRAAKRSAVADYFDLDESAFDAAEAALDQVTSHQSPVTNLDLSGKDRHAESGVVRPGPDGGDAPFQPGAQHKPEADRVALIRHADLRTNDNKTTGNTAVAKTLPSGPSAEAVVAEPGAVASSSSALISGDKWQVTGDRNQREGDLRSAEATAAVLRAFEQLMADGHHSLRTAARELGRPTSMFSGDTSALARFRREGIAGLLRNPQSAIRNPQFQVPAWFVPAAKFFYLLSNRVRNGGSVPEAIRRTISLPVLPTGWTNAHKARFLKAIGQTGTVPSCPDELRALILARQDAGQPLVPERLARQIAVNASVVQLFRSPRAWSLDNQSAPGSQRRYFDKETCQREIMLPGDWFGGDDATPGIAVCVPCTAVITPCSQKFGVLLGRFQWLAFHDARTDKILGWDYVVRPRGSYRAEDILNGMGTVVRTHGVPRKGWQFEGGTFNSKLVRQAIEALKGEHWRTYSPHQKAIESVFNRVWSRLAVQFPHADMGRYRSENEANCRIYELCKKGGQDPRKYFPTIELIVSVFDEEVKAHNAKRIFSEQYGQWVPDEFFTQATTEHKLREFSNDSMGWIFAPFAVERVVNKMIVKCRVPMFEDFSVPFEFNAPWMPLYDGKRVRIHFNPREPKCTAKVILLENCGTAKAGDILGDAPLIGETSGHIRLVMSWADDNQRAGYIARQKTNNFMRRMSRGIGANGRVTYASDEQRDGIAGVAKVESLRTATTTNLEPVAETNSAAPRTPAQPLSDRAERDAQRAVRRAELERLESETAEHRY